MLAFTSQPIFSLALKAFSSRFWKIQIFWRVWSNNFS